jgi:hypothetical protein
MKGKGDGGYYFVALVGEEKARELQQGRNGKKPADGKTKTLPVLDKAALAGLSKSERQAALDMAANVSLTMRASELPSPERAGHLLRTFGQSDREQISNASDEATVSQALAMLNSPIFMVLNNPESKLQQDLAKAPSPADKMDMLYMSLFSRHPSRAERAMLDEVIRDRHDTALPDTTHALLLGSQFLFVQ